jgi:hypothetical protein
MGFLTFEYCFWMARQDWRRDLYATLALFGVLFLTNFKLGAWLQAWADRSSEAKPITKPSTNPEPKPRWSAKPANSRKKKKDLEAEVAKTMTATATATTTGPVLGQDLQPVPPPNVRDLSVPQAKAAKPKKPAPEPAKAIEPR